MTNTQTPGPAPRCAVIMRIHFWDDFAARQFARLRARAGDADVFILVDETQGAVGGIPHDRVLRLTETDMLAMGLPRAGEGSMLWFNGDYPLYRFATLFPEYALVLQIEYDAVLNIDAAALLRAAASRGLHFVGLTRGAPPASWFWRDTCRDAYPDGAFIHQLICICILSREALGVLHRRRLAHAERRAAGGMQAWPMCEAFMPTEIARAGLAHGELSDLADTAAYDHWPPYLERDLPDLAGRDVIHPLLDAPRYAASMLKYPPGVAGFAWPFSRFHRKLRRLPARDYARTMARSLAASTRRRVRHMLRRAA